MSTSPSFTSQVLSEIPISLRSSTEPDPDNRKPFCSILFACSADAPIDTPKPPDCLRDLNLDQVISAMTTGREEYNLTPFFYSPLKSVEAVNYRYDVLRDLQEHELLRAVRSFAEHLRQMRTSLKTADKSHYKREQQRWFLRAVELYVDAVDQLHQALSRAPICSLGFRSFRSVVAEYVGSDEFRLFVAATKSLVHDLGQITYSLHIAGRTITVSGYNGEPDYGADVVRTFAKFSQGHGRKYSFVSSGDPSINHVEAEILDRVAELNPAVFSRLDEFCVTYREYTERRLIAFDREVQFYVACLENLQQFKAFGLSFCYPKVTEDRKDVFGSNVYDLALARTLFRDFRTVVTNDFFLQGQERILVVSGPNQGGKTTFARTFGQLHYLASVGCPVPGNSARLFLFDALFTHFEEEEDPNSLTGKLEHELLRIRAILDKATPKSILIMNESFVSTTVNDALLLSRNILQRIMALDMLCVTVTFLEELASIGVATVSMVSTVDPDDQSSRTYKVVRKLADGLAYARTITNKYRLTRSATESRITANMKEEPTL